MSLNRTFLTVILPLIVAGVTSFSPLGGASSIASAEPQQTGGQNTVARSIGVIKAINGTAITVAPQSGAEITADVQPNARILRLMPGEKDPKNATPITFQDVHVGDTIRVRGYASADGKSITTLEVMVITQSAVSAVGDQIRQDWQKRGLGGIVASVDPTSGTVTITIPSLGEKKTVTVHTTGSTVIRRYAPDSASFEAAKVATLQDIHPNDQLRARGDRSADGNDFNAVEIVAGTFTYVEGTIKSVDANANTVSVQDVLSKKTLELKITSDSQLHQVPSDLAQRMAFIVKRAKSGAAPSAGSPPPGGANPPSNQAGANPVGANQGGAPAGGMGGGSARGGGGGGGAAGGFQRMLDSTPAVKLSDLHKGDALAILATEGTASTGGTIIKLYSGVEPILEAAPNAMMLSPWSLGGAPGGDAGNQ